MNPKIDGHKLEFHPERVAQWKAGRNDWGRSKLISPIYLEVSPMGACNHRCSFCAVDYLGYKSVRLDAGLFADRMHEAAGMGLKSVMFAGEGEPLAHPQINAMNEATLLAGIDTAFTTNGTMLNRLHIDGTSWIKVSVNGGSAATYSAIHRCKERDWDLVWTNISEAVQRKGSTTIGVQTVMLPEVAPEAVDLAKRARDSGADYIVLKPYSQHRFSITTKYANADVSAYDRLEEELKAVETDTFSVFFRPDTAATKEIPYSKCQATPFFWGYIMATGDVYSCSAYLLQDKFKLGNINEQTMHQIWQGDRRKENWRFVREELDIKDCRVNCRADKMNRYLTEFETVQHINFV